MGEKDLFFVGAHSGQVGRGNVWTYLGNPFDWKDKEFLWFALANHKKGSISLVKENIRHYRLIIPVYCYGARQFKSMRGIIFLEQPTYHTFNIFGWDKKSSDESIWSEKTTTI